jgi:integrase
VVVAMAKWAPYHPGSVVTFIAYSVRAAEQQLVARNSCDAFRRRLPKVERMEMTTLTTEPAQRLLEVTQHRRIYLLARYWLVLIALATGMRRGESPALRYGHGRAAARSASIR